jgi:hypothetical protein
VTTTEVPARPAEARPRAGTRTPDRLAAPVFALAAGLAVAVQLALTRHSTFHSDEWAWAMQFRHLGTGVTNLWGGWFDPLARLAYNGLFATAGLGGYLPYRVMGALANLTLAVAVYAYGRHIGQRWFAAGAAVLLLLLGSGSWVVLIPLNSMNAIGLASLPACLVLLDRNRPRHDAAALVLLLVAMGFAGPIVLPVCAGLACRLLLDRPVVWKRMALVVLPVGFYLVARLLSPPDGVAEVMPASFAYILDVNLVQNLLRTPLFVAGLASAGAAGLLGLAADKGPAVLATLAAGGCLAIPRIPASARRRALAPIVCLVATWAMVAVGRAHLGDVLAPRYVAMTVLPILLVALEIAANTRLQAPGRVAVAGLVGFALLGNLNILVAAADALRSVSDVQRAELGALELALDRAPAGYRPDAQTASPLTFVTAGRWRGTAARLGSPALSAAGLPQAPAAARAQADRILRELSGVQAGPDEARAPAGCEQHHGATQVQLPAPGIVVQAGLQAVEVRVRRFADGFAADPGWVLPPGARWHVVPAGDRSPQPWTAEVRGERFSVCPANGGTGPAAVPGAP